MYLFRKIINRFFGESEQELLADLRKHGASIGKSVRIWSPRKTIIDRGRPWLLSIGDYTKITEGVVILTHDYSLSTMRRVYGEWVGEGAETVIGKNCFLGMNSILLMGTHLGDNVIVGAGSVVHGTFPDNVVIAGNPAKIICTLEEHYQKRRERTVQEAIGCVRRYKKVFGHAPRPKDLENFKFLFTPRDPEIVKSYGFTFQCSGDEPSEVEQAFYESKAFWPNFEAFLKDVEKEERE